MKNSCILGGFCKVVGIDWPILEDVLKKHIPKKLELNLAVARRGYDLAEQFCRVEKLDRPSLPIMTGNQAIGLGLIKSGLGAYVAYPMTPSSSLLDFMARSAPDFRTQGGSSRERDRRYAHGPGFRLRWSQSRSGHIRRRLLPHDRRA